MPARARAELGQKTRVDLVRLCRQRRDRLHLARVSDLDLPATGGELVANPERAAHHLQTRLHPIAQFKDEPSEPVPISRDPTLAGDLTSPAKCAPLRPAIRPIESDILHLGPPSRSDSSPESASGEEALLHDIPQVLHDLSSDEARVARPRSPAHPRTRRPTAAGSRRTRGRRTRSRGRAPFPSRARSRRAAAGRRALRSRGRVVRERREQITSSPPRRSSSFRRSTSANAYGGSASTRRKSMVTKT